jgi:glycerol-3-phosphate O-acyltransferase/dihydroxyacetone phosphate acyltransferase
MLYELLKPVVKKYYSVYYKFNYNSLKHVSKNKALVISPNHNNGFIDPVSIAANVDPKVRFFARGDVFKGRFAKWALNDMNISPMYRLQEGFSEIKKNNKSFEECRDLLSKNKSILIFPEAICIPEKRLQPLKKGLSRIVFQTEESFEFKKDVCVLPVGVNYTDSKKFRSDLFINFGTPISLKNYEQAYTENKVKAINEFTKELEKEMAQLIIHINNKKYDELAEGIFEIYVYQWMHAKKQDPNDVEKRFKTRKEIVEMINYQEKENADVLDLLSENVKSYLKKINNYNLRDHLLRPENIDKSGALTFITEFITLWFGMPFYLMAIAIHGLPLYIAKKIADKKIKQREFYASIRVNMGMLLWLVIMFIQLVVVTALFKSIVAPVIYSFAAYLLAKYALWYYPLHKKILGRWRLLRMVRNERHALEKLFSQRTEIIDELEYIKKNYLAHFNKKQH